MRRILIFSLTYYPRPIGGAEVAIKEITDRISPKDIEFHLIALRFDSKLPAVEQIGNVKVFRIGFTKQSPTPKDLVSWPLKLNKYLFPFLAYRKACVLNQVNRYDGIWSMMANHAGFAARFFKKKYPDMPFLLTLQEGDPVKYIKQKTRMVSKWFKEIFTFADQVQVISSYLADFARSMGAKDEPVVIPNGVDAKLFSQPVSAQEIKVINQEIGKKDGDIFLIHTGRLVKKNGLGDIIRSLDFLPENFKFLSIGEGPDLKLLKKLAAEIGVTNRVIFYPFVENKKLPRYLHVADIFIRPSLSEGMGNSFIEAMAAGLPVIATSVGGIADFLFDGKNPGHPQTGYPVSIHSPEAIAVAAKTIVANPEVVRRVVKNAKDLVSKKYEWNLIAVEMRQKLFEKI